jgi:hypothetical protein
MTSCLPSLLDATRIHGTPVHKPELNVSLVP